jgi:hypothetical protein
MRGQVSANFNSNFRAVDVCAGTLASSVGNTLNLRNPSNYTVFACLSADCHEESNSHLGWLTQRRPIANQY